MTGNKTREVSRVLALTILGLISATLSADNRRLMLDERFEAQRAIEAVYYAHQIGAVDPFDVAVPGSGKWRNHNQHGRIQCRCRAQAFLESLSGAPALKFS